MANLIRLIVPVVYLSGDETSNEESDGSQGGSFFHDFTSLRAFRERLQTDSSFLAEIQTEFPFIEDIQPLWVLGIPIFIVTFVIDPDVTYPHVGNVDLAGEPVSIAGSSAWLFHQQGEYALYQILNLIFYKPVGAWDGIKGYYKIGLIFGNLSNAITVLGESYDWLMWPRPGGIQGGGG